MRTIEETLKLGNVKNYIKVNETEYILYRPFTEMYNGQPRAKGKELHTRLTLDKNGEIKIEYINEIIYEKVYFEIDE